MAEQAKQSELNRRNTIGHTGSTISTVTPGPGFTSMVKEPLMNRMFGSKITVGSGYMGHNKYYESNDPIRPSSRAPISREYGYVPNDQELDTLNRFRLQASKRWRTPKNGARDRPSNQKIPNEKAQSKEYI